MPNEDSMKEFTVATSNMLDAFDKLSGEMNDEDKQAFAAVFGGRQPVGRRDTDRFSLSVDIISSEEVRDMRREVASAIAAENYVKGAMMAFKIISMIGGLP